MRWAIIRESGQVRACIPESMANLVSVVDPHDRTGTKIPALVPLPGVVLPLTGKAGISMSWEDSPIPLEGQPDFGNESSEIVTFPKLSPLSHFPNGTIRGDN